MHLGSGTRYSGLAAIDADMVKAARMSARVQEFISAGVDPYMVRLSKSDQLPQPTPFLHN